MLQNNQIEIEIIQNSIDTKYIIKIMTKMNQLK